MIFMDPDHCSECRRRIAEFAAKTADTPMEAMQRLTAIYRERDHHKGVKLEMAIEIIDDQT